MSRTLHECVDWNIESNLNRWVRWCRTLHECVDWNLSSERNGQELRVALYTSAWIEMNVFAAPYEKLGVALYTSAWIEIIHRSRRSIWKRPSHSTRVRGLKWSSAAFVRSWPAVALYTSAWIEINFFSLINQLLDRRTLHECVDWNGWIATCVGVRVTSHSTRVRGLK